MAPSDTRFTLFRLQAIRYGAEGINLYEFRPLPTAANNTTLASATAGSHVDVRLGNGMIRQYSLITPLCDSGCYTLGIKRDDAGRGGSRWLHEHLRVGDTVELGSPRNLFALRESQAPVVLLAGGIGITPVYAMYRELRARQRPVELHYWCRSKAQCLFYEELSGQPEVQLYLGSDGSRPAVSAVARQADEHAEIYCCGPARMIDELDGISAELGAERIHVERFQAAEPDRADSDLFTVVLARSGREINIEPGQSILDALRDEGVDVMYSCEQGICGACEQTVLDGSPTHQDSVASAEQHNSRGTMMICCSGSASSRLVLDI